MRTLFSVVSFIFMNIFLIILIFLLSTTLFPEEQRIFPQCKTDYEKFCKEILKPKARMIQCLLENKNSLSESCKSELKNLSEKNSSKMRKICSEDVRKFCKWVIPGSGRIIKCLLANESSLSDSCKKVMTE